MAMRLYWKLQNWNSVMNRILLLLVLYISWANILIAQTNTYSLEWGGGKYFDVKSFAGEVSPSDFIRLQLGSVKMKDSYWRITATVRGVEKQFSGTRVPSDFPLNMLNLRCNLKSGTSNVPAGNINNMLVWNNLQGLNNEIELVNFRSTDQDGYHQLLLNFDLQVQGGVYLRNIPRWTTYYFAIDYKLYTRNNINQSWSHVRTLGSSSQFQINIDQQQQTPVYSITVLPEALLEINSVSGYMNGISKTYEKALKISATDGYELKVKSVNNQFTSATTSRIIPLDIVTLKLGGGNGTQPPVPLSTTNELILQGVSTNGDIVEYDMIYTVKPIDDRYLFINEEQSFSTQLIFEITTR